MSPKLTLVPFIAVFWQHSSTWYQTTSHQQYPSLLHCHDLHICNWISTVFQKNKKSIHMAKLWPSIQGITVSRTTTSSREAIHGGHLNTRAFESYTTNKPGTDMFFLALPNFWTLAFTSPTVFWTAPRDKPNTDKRRRKSSERSHYTECNERSQQDTGYFRISLFFLTTAVNVL